MVAKQYLPIEEPREEGNYLLKLNKLPVILTIKKSNIFRQAYKSGITITTSGFILKFLPSCKNNNLLFTKKVQFGFAISKKLGVAVRRNYIKRRLKNAIKEELANFAAKGFYVFIAGNNLSTMKYLELRKCIRKSLVSLNCLLNNENNN